MKPVSIPRQYTKTGGPLCSYVARRNLGLLLGEPGNLEDYSIYKNLKFAPLGSAKDVHTIYIGGFKSERMVGEYLYIEPDCSNYGENIWLPPVDAKFADIIFGTPRWHRCVAYKDVNEDWQVLCPYFYNNELSPQRGYPVPLGSYMGMLHFKKGAIMEGVAFYK